MKRCGRCKEVKSKLDFDMYESYWFRLRYCKECCEKLYSAYLKTKRGISKVSA